MPTANLAPVESAGWISLDAAKAVHAFCQREGVDMRQVCARFGIENVAQLQNEDLYTALVFIGKNSKEKSAC